MPRLARIDRLFLGLFGAARTVFLLQGLAFGGAAAAAVAWARTDVFPWVPRALVSAALISSTFVAAGCLLWWMRSWCPRHDRDDGSDRAAPTRSMAPVNSLLLVAALTVVASDGLPGVWRQILAALSAIGFWEGVQQPGPGGLIILPLLLALFVPFLVTSAAVFSLSFPLALLARLPSGSRALPTMTSMGAVCQSALAGTAWLAAMLLRDLSQAATVTLLNAPDAEVRQLAPQLTAVASTLTNTATLLLLPAAVLVAWAAATARFRRHTVLDAGKVPDMAASPAEAPFIAPTIDTARAARPARGTAGASASWPLVGLGGLLLLFAGMDRLRSRPSYLSSTPVARASLPTAPSAIRVSFSRMLHPASRLSVAYLPVTPSIDDISRDVPVTSRLAFDDAERRTLEAILPPLGTGLYLVRWVANPESGGVIRHGSFAFGVGVVVPSDTSDATYSVRECDSGNRGRRLTLLGGVLLLGIGILTRYRTSLS